jgi:hypothetical protein
LAVQPLHGVRAVAHDGLGEIRIAVPLRDAAEIVEIILHAVLAEIRVRDLAFGEVRDYCFHGFDTVMDHAEAAARVRGVAAPLRFGRALED